MGNLE
jgi:hypothetical protein